MTLITLQDGKVVLRDGQVGTEQECCCGGACSCLAEAPTVTVEVAGATLTLTPGVLVGGIFPLLSALGFDSVCTIGGQPVASSAEMLCCQTDNVDGRISWHFAGATLSCCVDDEYGLEDEEWPGIIPEGDAAGWPDPNPAPAAVPLPGHKWIVTVITEIGCGRLPAPSEECEGVLFNCGGADICSNGLVLQCRLSQRCYYEIDCDSTGAPAGEGVFLGDNWELTTLSTQWDCSSNKENEDEFGNYDGFCFRDCWPEDLPCATSVSTNPLP